MKWKVRSGKVIHPPGSGHWCKDVKGAVLHFCEDLGPAPLAPPPMVCFVPMADFSSSRTWTGAEDEGEWKQFLSPGMKENIVLRRHRRQHRHPACRGTTRRCFVRKLHRRGAGNRQWFSLGPAAATNLGSVSLQPQWAMSGEWAEQIMGRTWLSEYVIIGTWIVSKLCFRWEMKYRGLLLLKFLSRFTLSNVSKLLLQFKLSKSNHAKGYREGSMHRIQGTYYCVII